MIMMRHVPTNANCLLVIHGRPYLREALPAGLVYQNGHAALVVGAKAAEPRDDAEARLTGALSELFRELLPTVAARLARGEMPSDEILSDAFARVIQPQLVEIAVEEFGRVGIQIGVQFDPAIVNQQMVDWARDYTFDLVQGLTETTQGTLRRAVQQFASTPGMTRGQLEALIAPAFGPARAEAIAVTEVTRGAQAAIDTYQADLADAGILLEQIFHTSADEKVCPICAPSNGKPESQWEGRGAPARHVRCRCFTTLRVKQPAHTWHTLHT